MLTGAEIEILEESNLEKVKQLINSRGDDLILEDENTPAHVAAYLGNLELLEYLIKDHSHLINKLNRYGWTPLMQACHQGHYDCVQLLLAHGANVNATTPLGNNALAVATGSGFEKIIETLIAADVFIDRDELTSSIVNPLHLAVLQSRDDIVKVLLRQGINGNVRNKFTQWTPLMTAAVSGEICTARLLFKNEIDGEKTNTNGQNAASIARKCKNSELAGFIDRKTLQNLSNSQEIKETIISAVKKGDELAVKKLLLDDASLANSQSKDAATPLMYASMFGFINLVEILLENGADIDAKDYENGWTALMQATYYGQAQIAKYLILSGANVNLRAKNGLTAFDMAMLINLNDTELFRMLADRSIEMDMQPKKSSFNDLSTASKGTTSQSTNILSKITKSFRTLAKPSKNMSTEDLSATMIRKKISPNNSQSLSQQIFSPLHQVPLNLRKTDDLPELGPPKTSLRRNIPPASPKTNTDSSAPSTQKSTTRKSASASSKTSSTLTPTLHDLNLDDDVRSVLDELSMTKKYQKIFAEQEIDIEVFKNLNQSDLEELGITQPKIRQKLMLAINDVKVQRGYKSIFSK
ncbi:Oidioi.mRNA.OKI2018_I69.PAR.g10575.t1.cds [Oikopleura dioica]|uniref:Oidioi.mRNA.OKI2018_I69.PAR.g10575.t1.cds n=1 Tax=Oikopleura dioica TaxID=34765 RepID=A0ABN7RRJ3_OIKDI|nr:Oidioi.mRNA.OKI2018_I69.PAR.g10575.t1.cds [Oikopleura dioica]